MKKSNQGSLTAEAAIVLPVVILVIMLIIRICVVHYQNVVVSAESMRVATRTAMYWQDIGKDDPEVFRDNGTAEAWITDGSFTEHDPYQSMAEMFHDSAAVRRKLTNAEGYAVGVMYGTPNLLGEDTEIESVVVERERGMLQNYITVTVTRKNENPLGYLYEKLGLTSSDEHRITAKSVQSDTTEFIRNVSLLYDVLQGMFSE